MCVFIWCVYYWLCRRISDDGDDKGMHVEDYIYKAKYDACWIFTTIYLKSYKIKF